MSEVVISFGATCFGIVLGYVTYRTLVRKSDAAISDIAAVGAAIGGGAVSQINHGSADSFGWYSIGLLIGFAIFLVLRLLLERDDSKPLILGE